jgi:two-component system, LytTR family, response regulator
MINCLLIDDEPLALNLLESYISKIPYLKLAGRFEEPLLALPLLESGKIDLLFLDIRMPDINGVDFFRSLSHKPALIFTSAYAEFAIEGFELKALDYLLKPVSFEKFVLACNRVKDHIEQKKSKLEVKSKDYFFINVAHKLHKIFYDDILYFEGYKDYTKLFLTGQSSPLLILHNLKYFEEILDETEFIRIHRSYIVSVRKTNTIARKMVTIGQVTLPVSDNYRDNLFEKVEGKEKVSIR